MMGYTKDKPYVPMKQRTAERIASIVNVVLYAVLLSIGVAIWKYTGRLTLAIAGPVICFILLKLVVKITTPDDNDLGAQPASQLSTASSLAARTALGCSSARRKVTAYLSIWHMHRTVSWAFQTRF